MIGRIKKVEEMIERERKMREEEIRMKGGWHL
jgi:hypothetical protein